MQNMPMAYNFLQWDFLLWLLLHTIHLVILAFLSREVLVVKKVNRSCRKIRSLNFFVLSCFRYPRYQRIIGHIPNCLKIFCLQLRLYRPVSYVSIFFASYVYFIQIRTKENKSLGGHTQSIINNLTQLIFISTQ